MADDRTPEQQEADTLLVQAIERVAQAYWTDDHSMVMDFIVLVQREDPTAEGESQYNYLLPHGSLPWHRIMGLMVVFDKLLSRSLLDAHGPEAD